MKAKMSNTTENAYATIQMIGQLTLDLDMKATTMRIAAFMGVSRVTAIARLREWECMGYVKCNVTEHRKGVPAFDWCLTEHAVHRYYANLFVSAYSAWRSKIEHCKSIRIGSQKSVFV